MWLWFAALMLKLIVVDQAGVYARKHQMYGKQDVLSSSRVSFLPTTSCSSIVNIFCMYVALVCHGVAFLCLQNLVMVDGIHKQAWHGVLNYMYKQTVQLYPCPLYA